MSTDRDTTRIVRSWLEEGATALPERVLDAVLDQLPAAQQRRPRWTARRFAGMNSFAKFALTIAAVAIVAIIGSNLISTRSGVGGPSGSPQSSSPSPLASPSPSTSATPAAGLAGTRLSRSAPGFLAAGDYVLDLVFDRPITITLPADWTGLEHGPGNALLVKTRDRGAFGSVGITVLLGIYRITGVYADPCRDLLAASPPPTTVDGFASALQHAVGMTAGKVSDTTVGGLPAKVFDLSNSIVADTCVGQPFNQWSYAALGTGNGTSSDGHQRIWLVDAGGTILVVNGQGSTLDGAPKADVDELDEIVKSIKFE